jgi:hypothetical protein
MVKCNVCGRHVLLGEEFTLYRVDGVGSEQPVCPLCADEAERRGWARVEQVGRRTSAAPIWHVRKVA